MRKIFIKIQNLNFLKLRFNKTLLLPIGFIIILASFSLSNASSFSFFKDDNLNSCEGIVNRSIKTKSVDANASKIVEVCARQAKTGNYKELYSYFKIYELVDRSFKDKMENNKYHWMLFYANENSRNFNEKTQQFEKEQGLYEQELKDFENNLTQEEKIKAFSYIADNLATGTEGWVKKHDYVKSFEYLKKAAEAGDNFSQSELGTCYFYGADRYSKFSFKKDYSKAYKWSYLATKHSITDAYNYQIILKNLKAIKLVMTKKQIIDSEEGINTWLRDNYNFVKNNPLKVINMTEDEIKKAKKESQEKIKKYNMFPSNNTNLNN